MQTNPQLQLAFDFVQYTGEHIFLTGKAGTGKTTFLKNLKLRSPKRMIVVAPTGVAAINAGGVTIHSFFQLSFAPQVGNSIDDAVAQARYSREKINIIKSIELLVIDEISMVRADLLDSIDKVLRRFKDRKKPFGGVQLLMIGDLQQLAPVVKDDERYLLRSFYDTIYFFSSKALNETSFVSIELTHVFRQQDEHFISILNKVRENKLDQAAIDVLNSRYLPHFSPQEEEGYITLCTHNRQANSINEINLKEIEHKEKKFKAVLEGIFPEYSYPTDLELSLKEGAQVMFVKNDPSPEKLFFNGKIGKIVRIKDDVVYVLCPQEEEEIAVSPLKWENVRYTIDEETNEIKESIEGVFTQYPLKLAWAITIHKSQGLTFERAIIDAEASFAHGQVYVALSRCKTLEGMVLSTPISSRSIISDNVVKEFTSKVEQNQPDEEHLHQARLKYQQNLLIDLFRFNRMRYLVDAINRIIRENTGAVPDATRDFFRKMLHAVQEDLLVVGEKFQNQIAFLSQKQADVESNEELQQRIVKASGYFTEKMQSILFDEFSKVDIEVDNKAVRKQMQAAFDRLEDECNIKKSCLQSCRQGFSVKALLNARAAASIEKAKPKKKSKTTAGLAIENVKHIELYNLLRSWRSFKASELGMPPYIVFSQKALFEMVEYLPTDKNLLKEINGMGSKKVSLYGNDILEIIKGYCVEKGIIPPERSLFDTSDEKQPKEDSKQLSYRLFTEGKSIEEIAKIRGLVLSTIEGHLMHFVANGELDASLLVASERLDAMCGYFEQAADQSLSLARESLGNSYSYSELRIGLNHFLFLRNPE